MRLHIVIAVVAVVVSSVTVPTAGLEDPSIADDIAFLYQQVRMRQWNDSVSPLQLPNFFGHEVGKYQTDVHFNFVGGPVEQELRSAMKCSDDNMFVTSFVLESIFDTVLLAPDVVQPDQWSVAAAVNATLGLRDRNLPEHVPIFGFWPQQLMSTTLGTTWEQWPINLSGLVDAAVNAQWLIKIFFDVIGLSKLWDKIGPGIIKFLSGLTVLFQIPSDADDSAVVMALTRYMVELRQVYPEATESWRAAGLNLSAAFEVYERYSYCINSPLQDKNIIDPRTYFWAHEYLNNITDSDGCIVGTWFQSTSEMMKIVTNKSVGPQMPLNVNNLDPTVGANSLYAMSTSLLYDETTWFTTSLTRRKLYLQTADFVAYALRTQPNQRRPDLELLYYPPEYDIVWFVARHVNMLESYVAMHGQLPFPEMEVVRVKLVDALRTGGVAFLLERSQSGAAACGYADTACWWGFLGLADTDAQGRPTPHYDDRYANTAVATLGLLDAFTVRVQNGSGVRSLKWVDGTPAVVLTLVANSTRFLRLALRDPETRYDNAFFSGSGKYWEQYQFWYPANVRFNAATNRTFSCNQSDPGDLHQVYYTTVFGASGKINDTDFDRLAKVGCDGIPAPRWFTGYNGNIGVRNNSLGIRPAWPYWSSPVLSYALAMQALAKVRAIVN